MRDIAHNPNELGRIRILLPRMFETGHRRGILTPQLIHFSRERPRFPSELPIIWSMDISISTGSFDMAQRHISASSTTPAFSLLIYETELLAGMNYRGIFDNAWPPRLTRTTGPGLKLAGAHGASMVPPRRAPSVRLRS